MDNGFVVVADGLRKRYGDVVAVDGISLEVRRGEIFGMVGPNGAGKTTTVECVEGLRRPDEGFALARALRGDPALAAAKLLIVTGAAQRYQMLFEPDDLWLPVDKVLEKPASGDDLVREIRTLLAKRQASGG